MKNNVLSEFSFLQPFNTQQLSWCAPSIISSSTELNHAGLILCIGHVPESQGGRWFKAVTQVTGMAHSTSSGHGVASDQASTQCGASRAAQLPWACILSQTLWPTVHTPLRDHKSTQETLPGMGSSEIWQRPPQSLKWRSASRKAWHKSSWDYWGLNLGISITLMRCCRCCDPVACSFSDESSGSEQD